jgi:hypothetical protein
MLESNEIQESKGITAFDLPRMIFSPFNPCSRGELVEALRDAQMFHAIYQDSGGNLQVLSSGYGPGEFAMHMAARHRSVLEFEFSKAVTISVEKFRAEPLKEADKFMHQSIEYLIEKQKSIFL